MTLPARYYNGTTSFKLTPKNWDKNGDEVVCPLYRDEVISYSYESLVAIVEPSENDLGKNEIMLLVRSWPPEPIDLWPNGGNTNAYPSQINDDIFHLDSIELVLSTTYSVIYSF